MWCVWGHKEVIPRSRLYRLFQVLAEVNPNSAFQYVHCGFRFAVVMGSAHGIGICGHMT
jgi:hypothetical protein